MSAAILFVDLDSTVRKGYTELGRFVNNAEDVFVFPEAVKRMREWRDRGGWVIAVTNQAGLALGKMSEKQYAAVVKETHRQTDGQIDKMLTCPHGLTAGCFCRKPAPGLLLDGVTHVRAMTGETPVRAFCLMVGDRPEDEAAADAAGVPFMDAALWRAMA